MNNSRKTYMAITGAAFIALGLLCICKPGATILSITWLTGLLLLVSGVATFLSWSRLKNYVPMSGNILCSAIFQILVGLIFINHKFYVASFLPVIFACFLLIEGVNLAIRAYDYKRIGFRYWRLILILGIVGALLGFMSLRQPIAVGSAAMGAFLGVGLILVGAVYIIALYGVGRFERRLNDDPWIDEQ